MRRRNDGAAGACAAALCIALLALTSSAYADDAACKTVKAAGEIKTLRAGQIIYGDLAGKIRIRIRSIDPETGQICGRVKSRDKCYKSNKVYTGKSLAACGRGAGAGAILLFDDSDGDSGDDESDEGEN
ncbi:MAG: hypothetical protein AAFX08_07705 [Pseudomonadota bacterium]